MLEAMLEAEVADFDPEDFERMEKENRQHFGRLCVASRWNTGHCVHKLISVFSSF